MTTVHLTNDQWTKLRAFLRNDPRVYVGSDDDCRRFLEAVLWIDRSGAQWRLLPTDYGHWNSIYKRFARWCDQGVWERMLAHFAHDPDADDQALGRSRGGFSTKIHAIVDGLGNPLRFQLTARQHHDSPHAAALLEGLHFDRVIADRGYAGQPVIDLGVASSAEVVIPPHPRANVQREYDR